MRVLNVHERAIEEGQRVAALIDGLASGSGDLLWPWERWSSMQFDRPLQPGARGGHGPIRYEIQEYEPGRRIRFGFTAPRGFDGFHEYRIISMNTRTLLQHVLGMRFHGWARLLWPLLFEPMHNALIEDSLDKAEMTSSERVREPHEWSIRVRAIRRVMRCFYRRKK